VSCSPQSRDKRVISYLFCALLPLILPLSIPAQSNERNADRHFEQVIIVVLENQGIRSAMKDPYIQELTKQSAWFSGYEAITHPSFPNYLALVAGSTFGIEHDHYDAPLEGPSIADRLEDRGLTWKSYAENYPGNCFLHHGAGEARLTPKASPTELYALKHVPLLAFANIQGNKKRCANVVSEREFWRDVKAGRLPHYAFYTPNMFNDGHDTSLDYSTKWLRGFVDRLKASSDLQGTLVVVTWDEGGPDEHGANHVLTLLLGPEINPGRYDQDLTHYSLLKSIENNFGVEPMHSGDRDAKPLPNKVWRH
jgi:hypothetical protein